MPVSKEGGQICPNGDRERENEFARIRVRTLTEPIRNKKNEARLRLGRSLFLCAKAVLLITRRKEKGGGGRGYKNCILGKRGGDSFNFYIQIVFQERIFRHYFCFTPTPLVIFLFSCQKTRYRYKKQVRQKGRCFFRLILFLITLRL